MPVKFGCLSPDEISTIQQASKGQAVQILWQSHALQGLVEATPKRQKKCKPLGIVTPSKLWLKLLQKSESASFGAKSCPLSVCWSYHQTTKLANPLANPHQLGFGWSGKLRGKVTPSKRWLNVPPKDKLCKPFGNSTSTKLRLKL
jgi:hypothetical protein